MGEAYDQSLLAAAPAATKAQLQEGYNPNLLKPSAPTPAPLRPSTLPVDKEDPTPPSKPPFWRTTKGIVIISLAALVVLGAIIGGAVGGTVGRSSSDDGPPTNLEDEIAPSSPGDGPAEQPESGNEVNQGGATEAEEEQTEGVVRELVTTLTPGQAVQTVADSDGNPVVISYPSDASATVLEFETTVVPSPGVDPSGDITFTRTVTFEDVGTFTIQGVLPAEASQ